LPAVYLRSAVTGSTMSFMPQRLIGMQGIATVNFADGAEAGTLGKISDAGFEVVRPDKTTITVAFSAIEAVENRVVILNCSESDLPGQLV
jgi:hypothetical protein